MSEPADPQNTSAAIDLQSIELEPKQEEQQQPDQQQEEQPQEQQPQEPAAPVVEEEPVVAAPSAPAQPRSRASLKKVFKHAVRQVETVTTVTPKHVTIAEQIVLVPYLGFPCFIAIYMTSHSGMGLELYNELFKLESWVFLVMGIFLCALIFFIVIFDLLEALMVKDKGCRGYLSVLLVPATFYTFIVGIVMVGWWQPETPVIAVMLHLPLLTMFARHTWMHKPGTRRFVKAIGRACLIVSILCMTFWALWFTGVITTNDPGSHYWSAEYRVDTALSLKGWCELTPNTVSSETCKDYENTGMYIFDNPDDEGAWRPYVACLQQVNTSVNTTVEQTVNTTDINGTVNGTITQNVTETNYVLEWQNVATLFDMYNVTQEQYYCDTACWLHQVGVYDGAQGTSALNFLATPVHGDETNFTRLTQDEATYMRQRIWTQFALEECSAGSRAVLMLWMSPLFVGCFTLLVGAVCLAIAHTVLHGVAARIQFNEKMTVFFMIFIPLVYSVFLSAMFAARTYSLSNIVLFVCFFSALQLMWWVSRSIGPGWVDKNLGEESELCKFLHAVPKNHWFQGLILVIGNVFILIYLGVNMLQRRARIMVPSSKLGVGDSKYFTEGGHHLVEIMKSWCMAHVFRKACTLCTIFIFVFVIGNRFLIVFLAFLNTTLSGDCTGEGAQPVHVTILIFFGVGYSILCIPGVPNGPVFILAGLLLTNSLEVVGGVPFFAAMWIVVAVGLFIQLGACATQDKVIGRIFASKVSMRAWLGVNSLPVRATKMMIEDKGITGRKIIAYIGIPVTSFLCGAQRLPYFWDEMLSCAIGFFPVIVPAVFSGSFMLRITSETPSQAINPNCPAFNNDIPWATLSTVCVLFAGVVQIVTGILMVWYTSQIISKHHDELAAQPPDMEVVEYDKKMEAARQAREWCEVNQSDDMKTLYLKIKPQHHMLFFAWFFQEVAVMMCLLIGSELFRDFALDGDLNATIENGGLDGSAMNVLKAPLGHIVLCLWVFGFILNTVWGKIMGSLAKKRWEQYPDGTPEEDLPKTETLPKPCAPAAIEEGTASGSTEKKKPPPNMAKMVGLLKAKKPAGAPTEQQQAKADE